MAINYAEKYAGAVDEIWTKASQTAQLFNQSRYKFTGNRTVHIYSFPTVPLVDYTRSGTNRYGNPTDIQDTIQSLTLGMDRAFTYVIDRGDRNETMMQHDAGEQLQRELRGPVANETDYYVLSTIAKAAITAGKTDATSLNADNAYQKFLDAHEEMGDLNVPDGGLLCFCTYKFYNLLKVSDAYIKQTETAQKMITSGVVGEVDGVTLIRVPKIRFPHQITMEGNTKTENDYGSFLMVNRESIVLPKTLETYKTHVDPPGINGWLVEGRVIYDAFLLDNKMDGVFYQGPATVTVTPTPRRGENWTVAT